MNLFIVCTFLRPRIFQKWMKGCTWALGDNRLEVRLFHSEMSHLRAYICNSA